MDAAARLLVIASKNEIRRSTVDEVVLKLKRPHDTARGVHKRKFSWFINDEDKLLNTYRKAHNALKNANWYRVRRRGDSGAIYKHPDHPSSLVSLSIDKKQPTLTMVHHI